MLILRALSTLSVAMRYDSALFICLFYAAACGPCFPDPGLCTASITDADDSDGNGCDVGMGDAELNTWFPCNGKPNLCGNGDDEDDAPICEVVANDASVCVPACDDEGPFDACRAEVNVCGEKVTEEGKCLDGVCLHTCAIGDDCPFTGMTCAAHKSGSYVCAWN